MAVQLYILRARDFFQCMQLVRDEDGYGSSAALLAIHSAISYADALRSGLGDLRLNAEDHRHAVDSLTSLLKERGWQDRRGFLHLSYLLSQKSKISYGQQRLDRSEVRDLTARAERFRTWVDLVGTHLKLEGWIDDDR